MIWSDLFMWGGFFNPITSLKIADNMKSKNGTRLEYIVYTLMTINAILSNYY
jgi:hypothetical protein